MLKDGDIDTLQWQCAFVYACRRRKGLSLSRDELRLIQRLRKHARAGTRPPQPLIVQALRLVATFKTRQRAVVTGTKPKDGRQKRLVAAGDRLLAGQRRAEVEAWRAELHREAFGTK